MAHNYTDWYDIMFTDYNTVYYTVKKNKRKKTSRKKFFKLLRKYISKYNYGTSISREDNGDIYIDGSLIEYGTEFKNNEVDNPNSEFNKEIDELIKMYDKKAEVKYSNPNSVENAISNIKFLRNIRYIVFDSVREKINNNRDYILEELDQDSEEYKQQLKEKIKDLKIDSVLNTILGLSFMYPILLIAFSIMIKSFIIFMLSIALFLTSGLFSLMILTIQEEQLISRLWDVKNNIIEILYIKKKLKQLKRTVYKPLQEKQKELEEETESFELVKIIDKIERLKKGLECLNNENKYMLSKKISDELGVYLQTIDEYKNSKNIVDISSTKKELFKVIDEVEASLKNQNNNLSQTEMNINYLRELRKSLANIQVPQAELQRKL